MIWLALYQVESSPVPPALLQLGSGVAVVWMAMQIVQKVLEFVGKRPVHGEGIQIELKSDPTTEYRLNKLDEEMKNRITRTEYESRHQDILRQLSRIESLIQRMYSTKILFDPREKEGE